VIEKLTSQPYPDFVRAEVLSRCGINDMVIAANRLEKRRSDEVKYFGQGENSCETNVARMDSHGRLARTPKRPRAIPDAYRRLLEAHQYPQAPHHPGRDHAILGQPPICQGPDDHR
jgi:CubicO group peptidase (beta-lactamase class C family)